MLIRPTDTSNAEPGSAGLLCAACPVPQSELSARSARCGFTIIELLVVIGIIGALVSITLPAVMAARESARRNHCSNNLKQLGLAVRGFENAFRRLPSSEPISLEGTPQQHGWLIYV